MTVHPLNTYAAEPALASARRRIVALFEKHRVTRGAHYDENRFMDFLVAEGQGRRTVADGFRASRRFNAFIEDVQYEFAICFSARDRHSKYSLQEFTQHVVDLSCSPDRALWPWKNQLTAGVEWALGVLANLVLLIAAAWLKDFHWALVALGFASLVVNAWFFRFAWGATAYLKRLRVRIADSVAASTAAAASSGSASAAAVGISARETPHGAAVKYRPVASQEEARALPG